MVLLFTFLLTGVLIIIGVAAPSVELTEGASMESSLSISMRVVLPEKKLYLKHAINEHSWI